jgi:hypothetical protein
MKILAMLVLTALVAACGKKEEGGEKAATTRSRTHDCRIIIAAAGEPQKFRGGGASEDAAWAAVCAELPEARRGDCRNQDLFAAQTATLTMNDQPTITVELTEKKASHEAKATSGESQDDACQRARADACKAAGADGDCVASGAFEETGRMAGSQTAM